MPSFPCISCFDGTSYKNVKDTATSCFTLVFTSADNIFHHTLEFHSTLFEKRFSSKIFFSAYLCKAHSLPH